MINKIYFENNTVLLCDEISPELEELIHHPETIYMDELSSPAINSLLHEINRQDIKRCILYNKDFTQLKKSFYKHFEIIKAAGGLIKNESGEILFIFRRGKWDLPKGKMDDGETAADCAVREVKEETGLVNVKAGDHICTTYHVYHQYGKQILKETDWFNMTASSQETLTPQLDEGIEKIEWVKPELINDKLNNSYILIADVIYKPDMSINY